MISLQMYNYVQYVYIEQVVKQSSFPVMSLWDLIPAKLLLQGDSVGWRTVPKDIQRTINA